MRATVLLAVGLVGCVAPSEVSVLENGGRAVVFGEQLLLGVRGRETHIEVVFGYRPDGTKFDPGEKGSTILLGEEGYCDVGGFLEPGFASTFAKTSTLPLLRDCSERRTPSCTARCSSIRAMWNLVSSTN